MPPLTWRSANEHGGKGGWVMREDGARGSWRKRLERYSGRDWYHALAEHAGGEFPPGAADPPRALSRRDFVRLLGASAALAGLGACVREPDRKIFPYVDAPPEVVPGEPLHYATAMTLDGFATGLVVESNAGRPTKVEGNPDHPASLGAAGIHEQASVLQLYDPHRARVVRGGGRRSSWGAVAAAFAPAALARRVGVRGGGLRLLLAPTASPLVGTLLGRVLARYPDARVTFYAPMVSAAPNAAARAVLGAALVPQYDFRAADVVVTLDADVLASGPFNLRWARDHAERRRARPAGSLYVAEPTPSPTGTVADHRIAATPAGIGALAAALLRAVQSDARFAARVGTGPLGEPPLSQGERAWASAAAADLAGHAGRSIVAAGAGQPAEVHAIVHALNAALGNIGSTVWYTPSALLDAGDRERDLAALAAELRGGAVNTLVVLEGNPCYGAPADLALARGVRAVPNSLYLGAYADETARACTWHVPAAHYLESWGDARAYDGTASLVQPLIAPLHGGRTVAELLAVLAGEGTTSAHDLLREAWRASHGDGADADAAWSEALRRGVIAGTTLPRVTPAVRWDAVGRAHHALLERSTRPAGGLEIAFVASHAVHDGQFADNAWLQELPDPVTKLTWDNAALMAPALAARLGVASGDVVALRLGARTLDAPALVVPGQADGGITLAMGYGRTGAEAAARGVGVDANALRTWDAPYAATGLTIARTGRRHALAITQAHWSIEGRGESVLGQRVVRPESGGAEAPPVAPARKRRPLTLYEPPAPPAEGFGADQWAMVIDLDVCTGCSACVVACQAENNVPVVGKEGVLESREMHWLRIDRYIDGPADAPRFETQPMLCQHCEKAPCEYVCPVGATVHSDDGLNEMIYNRCVGTRFCSNNCPYKVRRFNWFDYNAELAETERMVKNPQVTVRARGVMEKCTFCVQRVRRAQMAAQLAGEPRTGPVMTACQQTCPTRAIVFGSLTDPASEVARAVGDPRAFSALGELGTVPRVRYLARARNASVAAPGDSRRPTEGDDGGE
ncbi:MAG TPA: 4Fe-4S dicluster domain-containing protein [Gemmatimonadaceae bacterium]|nr:4Fe-4S dicluster domain-containing protein [Gemmatimonadaceae bacterium]